MNIIHEVEHVVESVGWLIYGIVSLIAWRVLAGYFAWHIHKTAIARKTAKPPVENWIVGGILGAALAAIWPLAILVTMPIPKRMKTDTEAEGEKQARQRVLQERIALNEATAKELGIGDIVLEEVGKK